MNLIQKGHRHAHRGIIGIEAAIVLIAFVIVAAALAFVVLNMGFSTTQKAKTAIIAAIEEAGSSMEISGKITAAGWVTETQLNSTNIPIKIVSGGASTNLDGNLTAIKIISSNREYDNIFKCGPLPIGTYANATMAWDAAVTPGFFNGPDCDNTNWGTGQGDESPYRGGDGPRETTAILYWTVNINDNSIIDIGEHVVLSVGYALGDRPSSLEYIAVEITVPTGATLTVERTVPNITTQVVDMG